MTVVEDEERQKIETQWISFAETLPQLAYEILDGYNVEITAKQFAEPRILSIALLCRTIRNFKGVLAVAKLGLVVEARALTRCCYENLFCIAGLVERGDEFVKLMYDDELRSLRSRGEFILDKDFASEADIKPFAEKLRSNLKEMKSRRPSARFLNPKEAVKNTAVQSGYLIYSQLSSDSCHPSITALKRHLVKFEEEGVRQMGFDLNPVQKGTELAHTTSIACNALIGACVGVNQILSVPQGTEFARLALNLRLEATFIEYTELSKATTV